MERKELGKILTHFQARARGYLLRKAVRHARADFQDIVREIDGNLNHLRWRDAILSIPHFTDTDGPLPRNTSSKSAPTPKLHCPETQPPEHLLEKTEREPYQQLFPEKIEAERDGLPFQKQPLHPRECSQGIPAGGRDQRHADVSHSHHDGKGSIGDSTTSTMWSSEELDTGFPPSQRDEMLTSIGGSQHHLTQDVPLTQEALRLHRNTLSMELLWLQQAITSRKKYLSLKQWLSAI
ncbi:unnamed protein product [Lota lota]